MNTTSRRILIAAVMATAGLTAMAQPGPGPAATGGPGWHHGPMGHHFDGERMQAFHAKRMATLKEKLKLSPEQESAWTAFNSATQPPKAPARPDATEWSKLDTPARIDRMQALHNERSQHMTQVADATKTFYAALNAEQKKIFDTETLQMMRGEGRRGGKRGPRN